MSKVFETAMTKAIQAIAAVTKTIEKHGGDLSPEQVRASFVVLGQTVQTNASASLVAHASAKAARGFSLADLDRIEVAQAFAIPGPRNVIAPGQPITLDFSGVRPVGPGLRTPEEIAAALETGVVLDPATGKPEGMLAVQGGPSAPVTPSRPQPAPVITDGGFLESE